MDALPKRAHQTRKPDPRPPSISTLRELSKGPRNKAPGPDGVPPYALHHLPDHLFQGVHAFVLEMYNAHAIPPSISESETVCFYKSGDWRQGDRWRPIALSNSLYRTIPRWIYHQLVPILSLAMHLDTQVHSGISWVWGCLQSMPDQPVHKEVGAAPPKVRKGAMYCCSLDPQDTGTCGPSHLCMCISHCTCTIWHFACRGSHEGSPEPPQTLPPPRGTIITVTLKDGVTSKTGHMSSNRLQKRCHSNAN